MNIELVKKVIESKLNELGFELYSLTSVKQKGDLILSIVVDRVEPIDMKTICDVSGQVSEFLDTLDLGDEPYLLDVSSLGAEKPLKVEKLKDYIGKHINVHLHHPINGENILQGDILDCNDESLKLEYRVKTRKYQVDIALNNISKARLAIKF